MRFMRFDGSSLPTEEDGVLKGRLAAVRDWESRAAAANFNARQLASSSEVSLRHLERFFQMHAGMSPQAWLDNLRLRRAVVLLSNGQSVKRVAYDLGFKQPSHFSQKFKHFYGLAPSSVPLSCPS